MVVINKANGDPRRTIDFQPLNNYCKRQTFPLDSPVNLSSRVPEGIKKSVVDAWNGYHSVPLHPAHRYFTTFLTPFVRFRYKVAPHGHMVSGDGFNERYSAITIWMIVLCGLTTSRTASPKSVSISIYVLGMASS